MDDSQKQMVFEANRKSVGIAYFLWLILGFFGVHRFYAGATKSGIAQLVLALTVVGWVVLIPWLLADLILIPGLVRDKNMETIELLTLGERRVDPAIQQRARPKTAADRKRDAMLEELRSIGHPRERR